MVINVLTPIIAFPTAAAIAGAIAIWGKPEKEDGAEDAVSVGETEGPIDAAGWAYGIWGVIFSGLTIFCIY